MSPAIVPTAAPAPASSRRLPPYVLWTALLVVASVAVGVNLFLQTRHERNGLLQTIARMRVANREELAGMWHVRVYRPYQFFKREYADRINWVPDATAPVAMAMTPRSPINEVDSIFQLYHGDAPQILFALTSSGVFVGEQRVDLRNHPQTMLPRPLTGVECAHLSELIGLMKVRRDQFEPMSQKYIWMNQVYSSAVEVRDAQAKTSHSASLNTGG